MSLSILRGCDTDQRFEMFRKMALIGETDGKCNLNRTQGCFQQLPGSRDTHLSEIRVWRQTNRVPEDS